MGLRYEIGEDNTVYIWNSHDSGEYVMLLQPEYPSGDPWIDYLDAEKWATEFIEHSTNPEYQFEIRYSPESGYVLRKVE